MNHMFKTMDFPTFQQNLTNEDCLSFLAFLAQQPKTVLHYNFENYSKILIHCIKCISNEEMEFIIDVVESGTIILNHTPIKVQNNWLFNVLMLVSMRHLKNFTDLVSKTKLQCKLFQLTLDNIKVDNVLSLHLLRLLEMFSKCKNVCLTQEILTNILETMSKVAVSPITGFKYYSQSISRFALLQLPYETSSKLCNWHNVPIRNVDTRDLIKINNVWDQNYIEKMLELFKTNVDSREAGFMYDNLLNQSFEDWKSKVWPFFNDFHHLETDGEFFQSLLKYVLPLTVKRYKREFYEFLYSTSRNDVINACALFELKKITYQNYDHHFRKYLRNPSTRSVALKISTSYFKITQEITKNDQDSILFYLYSCPDLNEADTKQLKRFFSHLSLYSHWCFKKNQLDNLKTIRQFLDELYKYFVSCFATNCDVVSKVLCLLFDCFVCGYKDLDLSYNLGKNEQYNPGENLSYDYLNIKSSFNNQILVNIIKSCFKISDGYSFDLTTLISRHFDGILNFDMIKIVEKLSEIINLQSCEKVKNYTKLSNLKSNTIDKILINYHSVLTEDLVKDIHSLFKAVLYQEIMIVVEFNSKTTILKTAQVISDILGQENFRLLNSKSTKVLETFINNTLELIRTVFPQLTTQEKQNIFDILTKIIQMSNMKRPVSLSVGVMALYGGPEDQNLRIKLLGDALNLVCQSPELLNVKIRRNPQCRLVIHALSAHEQNSEKPLLHWSMEHLIEILCKLDSSDSSIASSCHCLELLISDNTIQNHTMVYLERIIRCTIHLFDKDNWNVRNAQMQLIKVIIERYFGVAAAKSCRPKNILDLIIVYPNLRDYFSSLLQTMDVNKKSVMACLYISESNFHNTISHDQSMEETKCIFKTCLEKNLLEFSGYYGELISHSLTAMCPDDEIERDFEQTVEQIIENNYSLCVLKNFLVKLEELYLKYSKKHKLKCYLDKLVLHLQPEEEPLNFLLYRVLPANQILSQLNDKNYNNFQDRIWLHNNLITVDYSNCDVLKYVLENNIGDSLRVKILNIVASQQHCLDNGTMVLKVLVSNMLKSSNKYLISCYYNTILLLIKKSEIHFYPELRQFYSTENLYKIMVLIIFISCGQTNKTNLDLEFVERCVEIYKKEYNNEVIASSLKYLFSCLCCEKLKLDVLKIAFCLFLNVETNTEICDFFNCTMNEFYSIPILSLKHFLTYENLIKHLSHLNVGKFLKEIHDFTTNLNDVFSDSDTFYLVQNDSVVPKSLLVKILYICMSEYMDNCFYCVLLTKRFTGQITTRTKKKKKKNKRRGKNPKNVFLCVSNTFEDTCCVFRIIKTGSENIL